MSVNTVESANAQPVAQTQNSELIYRLEDRPPLPQTLFAACQHLLAMFVAVITPALLICQALGLPAQDTQHIISMSLFASGVASIIQIKAWGPVGSGLLSIQGTSFNFVAPLIMGGTALKTGGADVPTMMAALFGTLMLASCTEMVLSRILHLARRIITPLVSGVVVMIIGLSLIQVGLTSIGGGYAAMSDNTFGAPKNLMLAGVVLALIILLNRQRNPYLRVASLVIAMAAGYLLAWFMGMLPENTTPATQDLIMVPTPLYYGLGIDWNLLLPLMLVFPWIMKKIGGMSKMVGVFACIGIVGYIIVFVSGANLTGVLLGGVLGGLAGLPLAYYGVLFIMNCCTYNEMIGLPRMDGSAGILANFMGKCGGAMGSFITGILLSVGGYIAAEGTVDQPASALMMIRIDYALVPAVLMIVIAACSFGFMKLEKKIPAWEAAQKAKAEATPAENA